MDSTDVKYIGFWLRVVASIIDSILTVMVTLPLLIAVYGMVYLESTEIIHGPMEILISWVLPAVAVVLFWIIKQATPGKMVISACIVDAETGGQASNGQLLIRYLGYFIAAIPLGLGLFWIAFDRRKQGWHDKLAGTVVVHKPRKAEVPSEESV
ncbi:RDD family protein [Chitinimonas sp. PSY-7]|uniref:RDD family protein n=1 Tax=Chitinimonas sp. PSY-7 TaxID=3459088 RepID=UPI0040402F3E